MRKQFKYLGFNDMGKTTTSKKEQCTIHSVSGSFPVWTTDCPTCKTGRLFLFEKGGSAKCDNCNKSFYTDYEVHDELTTREVEYWLVD